ncbi:MAG: alpha,alpha-phosphotrehalase [Clostridiales Family XIII bacterium]|jgi:glycosidase|nr:alpha,alpha-phosphotrehalase [Clostridiales Family XIII bacterium]
MSFKDKVIYQIYPKSFLDTNGDGVGDFEGIIRKLPYLRELGINMIWLNPFYPSPQNDNGYDIKDYCAIDKTFGTMADFERLVETAKEHEIELMLDMVLNHVSTEHIWFQKALAGDKKYEDYFILRDTPTDWVSKFGGNAWAPFGNTGRYYLRLFDVTQADLNWRNPDVRAELEDVLLFWMGKGVKGFRFDVINLIGKDEVLHDNPVNDGKPEYTDKPITHEYLRNLNHATFGQDSEIVTVGEMSSTTIENCVLYTEPSRDELSMTFNFHHLKVDYLDGQKWSLVDFDFEKLRDLFHTWGTGMSEGGGWNALFWNNHDQPRALNRFIDLQAGACADDFGSNLKSSKLVDNHAIDLENSNSNNNNNDHLKNAAKINRQHRDVTIVDNHNNRDSITNGAELNKNNCDNASYKVDTNTTANHNSYNEKLRIAGAKMLATAIHLSRGTPYIYMGEEIGMLDPDYESMGDYVDVESVNAYDMLLKSGLSEAEAFTIIRAKSRDNARIPMQWDDSVNAGFTTGTPWLHAGASYQEINVKNELANGSIFKYYQRLIALRKTFSIISEGDYEPYAANHKQVYAYIRKFGIRELLVLNNFFAQETQIDIPDRFQGGEILIDNYWGANVGRTATANIDANANVNADANTNTDEEAALTTVQAKKHGNGMLYLQPYQSLAILI